MSKKSSSPAPQITNVTQSTKPPEFQLPFLKRVFGEAEEQFDAPGPLAFPGQQVVGFTPEEQQAQTSLLDFAGGQGQQAVDASLAALNFGLGPVLDPASNPALAAAAEGATRPIFRALTEKALPAIRGGAIQAGQLGGTRQGIAEGLAVGRTSEAALDATSKLFSENFQSGLDLFGKSLALAPQTLQLGTFESNVLGAVGGQDRALEQAIRDEEVNRFIFEQNQPSNKLAQFANLVSGNFGAEGSSITTQEATGGGGKKGGSGGGGIGGALSGAATGAAIGSIFPGYGTIIGAGIGGLIGAFG